MFFFIRYNRPLTIIVEIIALFATSYTLKELTQKKTSPALDHKTQKKTYGTHARSFLQLLSLLFILGIIVLVFVINSIEFICFSFIPALFTQTPSSTTFQTGNTIIIRFYKFFTLDNLIFLLAIFTIATLMKNTHTRANLSLASVSSH